MAQEKKAQPYGLRVTMEVIDDSLEGHPQEILLNQRFTDKEGHRKIQAEVGMAVAKVLINAGQEDLAKPGR